MASDFDGIEADNITNPKNISINSRNFINRKDDILKFYKTAGNSLQQIFTKQIGEHDNFGFNSHNEFFVLGEDQKIVLYNNSGIQILESDPIYLIENFDNYLSTIDSVNVWLGGEAPYTFDISEIFDPYIQQEVVNFTDYTDQKELVFLVKNSFIGQFITPPCDNFIVSCYEWREITQTPIVTTFTVVRLDYNDITQIDLEIVEIGRYNFYNTDLGFSRLQEGRNKFILGEIFNTIQEGLVDRVKLSDKVEVTSELLKTLTNVTFPKSIKSLYSDSITDKRIEIFNNVVLDDRDSSINSQCGVQSSEPKYIFRSRNNLYADLTLLNQQNGVQINATTFDNNFARYEIHWSAVNTPAQWNFLHSSSQSPVAGDIVYNWLPNQNGFYNLKLTAYDKAGNTTTDVEQIAVNNTITTIRNIEVGPTYFSPNGDGIQDTVNIQYEVLTAADVLIEIEDETGLIVRSYAQEYLSPLALEIIQWDGKDQNGSLLADGKYHISVQGFRYDVYLDTLAIEFSDLDMFYGSFVPYSFGSTPPIPAIITKLTYPDAKLIYRYELFDRQDYFNHNFQFFNQTTGLWQDAESPYIILHANNIIGVTSTNYRLKTLDKASNLGLSNIDLPMVEFWQTSINKLNSLGSSKYLVPYINGKPGGFIPPTPSATSYPTPDSAPKIVDWSINNKLAYVIQTFSYDNIESIHFTSSYTDTNTGQTITQSKLVNALTPSMAANYFGNDFIGANINGNNLFDINIDGSQIPFFMVELEQNDFPDTTSVIYVSFEIKLVSQPSSIITSSKIQFRLPEQTSVYLNKLTFDSSRDLQGLPTSSQVAYDNFIHTIPQNLDLEYYWIFLDGNYNLNNNSLIVNVIGGKQNIYSPHLVDNNQDYYSVLFIIPASTCKISKELIWQAETVNGISFESPSLNIDNDFCIRPEINALFYLGEFCNHNPPNNTTVKFELSANNINPQSNLPILVELYQIVNNFTTDELIFADTNPQLLGDVNNTFSYTKSIDFDTSQLSTGEHNFRVVMTDSMGEVVTKNITIQPDTHTAINQINSPLENRLFCAATENPGNVEIDVAANVSLSSPYGAQIQIIVDGNTYGDNDEDRKNYQAYNSFAILENLNPTFNDTKIINIPRYSGVATLLLETFNSSGVSYCSNVNISIDSFVDYHLSYSAFTVDGKKNYLSPNNDNINDTLKLIIMEAHEALNVDIQLYNTNNLSSSLGTIASTSLIANEIEEFIWDGKLNSNNVADGQYIIVIEITDNCGLVNKIKLAVVVDTIAPQNVFITPVDTGALNAIQRVKITIDEEDLVNNIDNQVPVISINNQVVVDYFYNGVWNQLEIVSANYNPTTQLIELQLDWNLTNLPVATYPLRITTEDLAGNIGTTTINPELINTQNIFWDYTVSPIYISPNADTIQDTTTIEFGLNLAAIVTINILDANQNIVTTLLTNQSYPAQANQVIFNGMANSVLLNDGTYSVEIIASEAINLANTTTLELPIIIDNQAPSIQWLPPLANVTKGEGMAQVILDELYPSSIEVKNQQLLPLEAETTVLTSSESGTFDLLDLQELNETQYQLTAIAKDLAGNSTTTSITYLIDKTAPEIELITPANDALVGGNEPQINITGNIVENNFEHYELSISPIIEPHIWQTIHTSTELIAMQFAYQWLFAVNDGQYLLRLSAYDQAGWLTEINHTIILDKTPPLAQISQPLNNSLVGKNAKIIGTATDENFDFYILSYKLSTANSWSLFNISQSPIISAQLGMLADSLPSDTYDIKLTVQDKLAMTSESQITVTLDISPPPAPMNLTLEIINNQVSLNWDAVSANDLAGYILYRNGAQLLPGAISATQYLDATVTDGQYVYTVSAVDALGNISQPSNQVSALIDTTPPAVLIIAPAANQKVNSTLEIIGTALSLLDFNNYKLYYRQAAQSSPGTLIQQSTVPVTLDLLGVLDTTVLTQEQDYTIRLEASDNTDNTAVIEQSIFVDNIAPSTPLNLTHQLQGQNEVLLQWTANNESDLAGYLVFQNGVVISGTGNGNAAIGNAITALNFTAENLVDGTHQFTIAAIDETGNISQFSNSVTQIINSRVPDTIIITPVAAEKFETPIVFEATSLDNDVAQIKFEYSVDNITWTELATDQQPPFQTTLNPVTLNLTFGDLHLRATATDTASQVDATPALVTVEYADLTAPLAVTNFNADINAGTITLNWDANVEVDLQGYIIYSIIAGVATEVTNPPITATTYVDNNLLDDNYSYQIKAIDNAGNKSDTSQLDDLLVFSINLEQPYSPLLSTLLAPAQIQLNGDSLRVDGTIQVTQQNSSGNTQLADILLLADNTYTSPLIDLTTGLNSFAAMHNITASHKSKIAVVQVELSPIPVIPINLQANVVVLTSNLSWDATADTFAYLVYKNSQPVAPIADITTGITYQASSNAGSTANVADDDIQTYWYPSSADLTDDDLTYIELTFAQTKWITSVELTWYDDMYNNTSDILAPSRYAIQYLSNVGWITIAELTASNEAVVINTTNLPYLTNKVRLLINNPAGVWEDIALAEFKVTQQPTTNLNSISLVEADGIYSYQVASINNYGFASTPTDAIEVHVGDTTAPETVTLAASVAGNNDVTLNWNASISVDVSNYWLFRDNQLILITADASVLNYTDTGLANGNYGYHIKAVDAADNTSINSNIVNIDIQQQALPIPANLTAYALLTGNAAQLNWAQVSSPRLHHYNIYRSLTSSTSLVKIAESIDNNFIDTALINSTRYYYVVTTADEFTNESDYSNEVSVTPSDSVPAATPVITLPTTAASPIIINQTITNIYGYSEPGVLVDLYNNANYLRTVTATTEYSIHTQELMNLDTIVLNENGQYNAYVNFSGQFMVQDKVTGDEISADIFVNNYSWNAAGTLIYIIQADPVNSGDKLSTYDLELNETEIIFNENYIYNAISSPDASKILYQGSYTDPQTSQSTDGLWLFDRATSTTSAIPILVNLELASSRIAWSQNNQYIAFINTANAGELYLYNLTTQTLDILDTDFGIDSTLDWSNDSNTILYNRDTTNPQLFTYNLASSSIAAVANTNGIFKHVNYSPDNSKIVYLQDCCSIKVYDVASQSSEVIYQGQSNQNQTIEEVIWNHDFGIEFSQYDLYSRVANPGYFTFTEVLLEAGVNQIHVIARDASGIPSAPSLPITITVESTGLPDISVASTDLLISPASALQGSNFVASIIVENISYQAIINADITVNLTLPDGSNQLINLSQNQLNLQPFTSQSVFIDLGTRNMIGDYVLQILVDGQNQLVEFNENNNNAYKTFMVLANLDPTLQMFVAPEQAAPNQPIAIAMSVYNPAELFNGKLCLTIADINGFPVSDIIEFPISGLASNATYGANYTWNTQELLSGIYQIKTQLKATNGDIIKQVEKQIEILTFAEFSISLDTQNNTVTVGEELLFSASIAYTAGNTPQNGTILWEILDSGQQMIWTQTTTLPQMLAGFATIINNQWQAQLAGNYQLKIHFNADDYQQTLLQPFTVLAASAIVNLQGQLEINPTNIILGDNFTIDYNLTNAGNVDLNNIPISLQLLSTDLSTIIANNTSNLSLAINQSTTLNSVFSSAALTSENYLLALYADLTAVGGNSNELIDTRPISAIDTTAPEIIVTTPQANSLQPADVDIHYSITDQDSAITSITIQSTDINQANPQPVNVNQLNELYNYQLFNLTVGAHQIVITATDSSGNFSQQTLDYSVDPFAPTIAITGVQDNSYYNHAVTTVVAISDDNLATSEILLNSTSIPSTHNIAQAGNYFLNVRAADAVANISSKSLSFTLDFTAPAITITFPENNTEIAQLITTVTGYTNEDAQVDLTIGSYQAQTHSLVGGFFRFVDVPLQLGGNTIDLQATDLANNQSAIVTLNITSVTQTDIVGLLDNIVNFPVEQPLHLGYSLSNNTSSDFLALDVKIELYDLSTQQIIETQLATVDLLATQTLQAELIFSSPNLLVGNYQAILNVWENNQWQQKSEKSIRLYTTEFGVHVNLPINGGVYNANIVTSVDVTDIYSSPPDVQYQLDSSNTWISMVHTSVANYIANLQLPHGSHVIRYRINDGDNQNQQYTTIFFTVDSIAPEIIVANPTNGLITNQAVILEYTATDDNQFDLSALLNGATVNTGDSITSEGDYTLEITATDIAENQANETVQFIIDTTSPTITLTNLVANQQFMTNNISITGTTEPFATLVLDFASSHYAAVANEFGEFSFNNVNLLAGANDLLFVATDRANNQSTPLAITIHFSNVDACTVFGFKSVAPYNAFVFNDYTAQNSAVQGRLAVGNNVFITGYHIGEQLLAGSAGDVLIAGGNINFAHQQLYHGNILASGQANIGQIVIDNMATGTQIIANTQIPIDFNVSYQQLKLFSSALAQQAENSSYIINNQQLQLQGDCTANLQVYNINNIDLENIQSINYSCLAENAYIILNVASENINFSRVDLSLLQPIQQRLIWNFHQARNIELYNINIAGSILAIDANIYGLEPIFINGFESTSTNQVTTANANFGFINGQVIAHSFNSQLQVNQQPLLCSNNVQVNSAPIVNDMELTTQVDTAISFGLEVLDEHPTSLQYQQISQVASGQLTGTMPDLIYTPAVGFTGNVDFTYQVTDQFGKSSTAIVSIIITANKNNNTTSIFSKSLVLLAIGINPLIITQVLASYGEEK